MKIRNRLTLVSSLATVAVLSLSGCGKAPPEHPKIGDPIVQPEEAADPDWDTSEDSDADAAEPEARPAPELKKSGRPALKLSHSSLVSASVDAMGAELRLANQAALVFPVDALDKAVPYRFAQRKGIGGPKRIGLNYDFAPAVSSAGDPFILELPLPKWAKQANFAIRQIGRPKAGQKRGWTVVAATRLDHDRGVAILETHELPEGWIYLTPKRPD